MNTGYLIRISVALGVAVPLILAYLCLVQTAAAVLSCLIIKTLTQHNTYTHIHTTLQKEVVSKRYSGSAQSVLSQPEADVRSTTTALMELLLSLIHAYGFTIILVSQSTRNSAAYAEIGPISQGKKAVMMLDTTVPYAVVKKKQKSLQCEMGKAYDHDPAREVIPGSGILIPNSSYELIKISQKQREPGERVETERNPAYATLSNLISSRP